jgi:hypothetical protein
MAFQLGAARQTPSYSCLKRISTKGFKMTAV